MDSINTPRTWTFLTNHAHVLVTLAADPEIRVRDLADRVAITERAAMRILHDLEAAGFVQRERDGRRTHYCLRLDQPMRHPIESGRPVRALVDALADMGSSSPTEPPPAGTYVRDASGHAERPRRSW